jgi:hypothetical protein
VGVDVKTRGGGGGGGNAMVLSKGLPLSAVQMAGVKRYHCLCKV